VAITIDPNIVAFRRAVDREVERSQRETRHPSPWPDIYECRRSWVDVFIGLCDPLYERVCLNRESQKLGYQGRRGRGSSLSDEDVTVTLESFERFCGHTEINGLLDSPLACYVLSDCLCALSALVQGIVGWRRLASSFSWYRIGCVSHLAVHILVAKGLWSERFSPNRDQMLKAIREIEFPFEKYCGYAQDWLPVG
jgi:hypothetical protein